MRKFGEPCRRTSNVESKTKFALLAFYEVRRRSLARKRMLTLGARFGGEGCQVFLALYALP